MTSSLKQTSKELIRSGLARFGLYDFARKLVHKKNLDHLAFTKLEDRFSHIYRTGHWRLGSDENPGSGAGSSLEVTRELRDKLPDLFDQVSAQTVLDIGCGDFTWMREVDLSRLRYIGADIVQSVVEDNRDRFGNPNLSFVHANALEDNLPDADTVLIREVLFHLCFDDIRQLLTNVLRGDRKWILMTTDGLSAFNADIVSGDWRLLNLTAAPFRFPAPVHFIDESVARPGRILGAWPASAIRSALI